MEDKRNARLGRIALVTTTLIWGSSFVILKSTLDSVPTLWVLAMRFTGAACLMALIGFRELKKINMAHVRYGVMLGAILYAAYVLQTFGLVYTTPAKNAFLTATYCVIVPFLWWAFLKKRPDRYNIMAAFVCMFGMALVSLEGDLSVNIGDVLTMCCGFFYALHIIITARAVEKCGVVLLSIFQFLCAAVLCWISAPLVSAFPQSIPASAWISIAYLCVMCTGVCFLLQSYGQKYTPPQSTAIILTLESVFGTFISLIFYHEQITFRVAAGFMLIFVSIVISETKLGFLHGRKRLAAEHVK